MPNIIPNQEPMIFVLFPDVKNEVIQFCNKGVAEGNLSTEIVLSELRNKILPSAYERMVLDAPEEGKELLREYNIFLNI